MSQGCLKPQFVQYSEFYIPHGQSPNLNKSTYLNKEPTKIKLRKGSISFIGFNAQLDTDVSYKFESSSFYFKLILMLINYFLFTLHNLCTFQISSFVQDLYAITIYHNDKPQSLL
jgi:hypothetical protein